MYNLIESSDNYSKTSGSLWQYCIDMPAVDDNGDIVEFTDLVIIIQKHLEAYDNVV